MLARGRWTPERGVNFLDGTASFYGSYACACGGYVAVGPIEPAFFAEMLERLGLDASDFDNRMDPAIWPTHKARLAEAFLSRTRDAWAAIFADSDGCVTPILSMAEAPSHPHVAARETFVTAHGAVQPAPAPRFSRTPSAIGVAPPLRGEHGAEILAEFAFSAEEIESLTTASKPQ
jgi:alpha-methylacyl-CoA racemase